MTRNGRLTPSKQIRRPSGGRRASGEDLPSPVAAKTTRNVLKRLEPAFNQTSPVARVEMLSSGNDCSIHVDKAQSEDETRVRFAEKGRDCLVLHTLTHPPDSVSAFSQMNRQDEL